VQPTLGFNQLRNLTLLGKSSGFGLGEHLFAVHNHIENAVASLHEFCFYTKILFQFVGQTGRSRIVVSHGAVVNLDLHLSAFRSG
jgi:hypothetical protein